MARLRFVTGQITEIEQAGWTEGIDVSIFRGPGEYLYGEETGLLEAIDGRPPFPRVAPPYRHGVEEEADAHAKLQDDSSSPAHIEMAAPTGESDAPPTLAQNVETLANVPAIFANGADWFRTMGTGQSPGTVVCTVSGHVDHAGVAEMAMGTPLGQIIDEIAGGARPGRQLVAAMSGVANALVIAEHFDTPASHEAMRAIGSGLGAAGFMALHGVIFLLHTLARVLDIWLPISASYGIVTLVLFIVAAVLGLLGKKALDKAKPAPSRAIAEAKQTVATLKS